MKFLRQSAAGCAAGFSLVSAQDLLQTPATSLDPMIVDARAHSTLSLTAPTAAERREELAKTAGGAEVIAADRYLTGRASTVADTFALSPGVVAQPRFGSDEARLSIRGSGLQRTFHGRGLRVLQDGVPLNLADGSFDFQALDPLAAAHIDVWRGANALAYGSSTLGGAIDYVSRSGLSDPGGSFRLEAGSYGYLRSRLAAGFRQGPFDLYASLSDQEQDGFRDHSQQSNQRFFANFGLQPAEDLETRFYLTAVTTDSELPGSLTKAELERDPRQADESATGAKRYDNHRDFQLFRAANRTTLRRGDTTWEFTAAWTHKDLNHPLSPFAGVIDQLTNDLLLGATATHESRLFGRENRLRAGLLFSHGEIRAASFENDLGRRGALRTRDDQTAVNLEAFLEDRQQLGAGFTGIAGFTAAHNLRESDRRFSRPSANPPFYTPPAASARLSYDESYSDFSPKLGLLWDGPGTQIYANLSGSYEPPSFSETVTSNVAREAQTATTFELGTRGARGPFRWDLSVYYAELDHELLTLTDPVTLISTTTNADKTLHRGIELGGEADLLGRSWDSPASDRLVLRSAWTYGDFRFDHDRTYGDNRIAGLPPHLIRGELQWENAAGWYAGPTFEWVPVKSYVDHRNTLSADPYALVGFKFGRRVPQGLSWFIEAKNLTDEHYAATYGVIDNAAGKDQRQFLPGDGRSVFAGLEWRW